ncbi:MAG TPA: large conductance mechanosensitive channel protein MscL [Bacteroidia bacterium]|jgi:large conductance mechanosensitive channel|nr:large conductance mechanosensitive channel protein MscL [Bacteroidia bacterium]
MGIFKEFREFAVKGNVIDLAVGVIIGAAFGKIISSLIDDVITPLILKPALDAAHLTKLEELTMFGSVKYGTFIAAVINFVLVAFTLFLIIKAINAAKRRDAAKKVAVAEPTKEELLLTEIRDLLKEKK